MAINPNTDFTSGAILTAAQQNRFPRGVMGYVTSTANSSALGGTPGDVGSMSITFTAVANRTYRATFTGVYSQSVNTANVNVVLADGSNNSIFEFVQGANGAAVNTITFQVIFTASAGSVTRKIRAYCASGTVTFVGNPASQRQFNFTIEDMGPA
jgi:hypothetical protein